MNRFVRGVALLLAGALLTAGAWAQVPEKKKITIAVGGKNLFYYLPLTVAERKGYFKDEGLEVEIPDFAGGAKALQALVGGSADMVSGAYEHTINMVAKKQPIKAVVLQAKFSSIVLLLPKDKAAKYKGPQDLKGLKIGVTAPGSSTNMFVNNILAKDGLKPTDVSIVGVGTGTGAFAAMDKGEIDALSNLDPVITQLESTGKFVAVADSRTEKGMKEIYGGDYMASVIYITDEYIKKNPNTVQAVVNAMVRADKWIAKATPQEIVDLMPAEFKAGNPSLYKEAPAQEHDRLLGERRDVAQGRGKRLQGARAVRALGDGRGQDGREPDVRQFLREEGEREVQVDGCRRRLRSHHLHLRGRARLVHGREGRHALDRRRASSSPWWARPVAASRRCSTSPPDCCGPRRARRASSASRSRASTGKAGYMFQSEALMPWRTALANVTAGLEFRGVAGVEAKRRGEDWLARVGLAGFGDRYPHQMSGGMRKRASLAQMLILDPQILLMDEPFSALDIQTRQLMENELLELWSANRKSVIFITHDLEEAISLSDRVVVLSAGPAHASHRRIRRSTCRARATWPRSVSRRASSSCTTASGTR